MPIIIKELVIRGKVTDAEKPYRSNTHLDEKTVAKLKTEIINECVEKAVKAIKREIER